jgi:hypothetical protein
MSIFLLLLFSTIGIISFLFIFWRKLKEDYLQVQIFSSGLLVVFFSTTGALISLFLIEPRLPGLLIFTPHGLWFWTSFIAYILSLFYISKKYKMKIIETFNASFVGMLIWLALVYLSQFISKGDVKILALFALTLTIILIFKILDSRYRYFSWYKSGKVGFASLAVAGLFFLARAAVAIFFPSMLSLVGRVDVIISAVFAFLFFFSVYNLSEL